MPKDQPDSWTVDEVVEEDENGTFAIVRISQNSDYVPDRKWPERGQQLMVKDTE